VFPPIEPMSTASLAFAAAIASSVRGSPHASIEQPPIRISVYLNSCPNFAPTASSTLTASVTTSGPIPSPLITPTLNAIIIVLPN